MSEIDVIKEFLVKLGFKVDAASTKKMNGVITEITKSVNALGIATDISLAAVAAFTVKTAEALDKLYFASQRTGSSVTNIKAFDYATSQLGGSAADAQASLENLGQFIRSYPGSDKFLEALGVAPEHVKDSTKALEDLGKTFQRIGYARAKPYANLFGIDDKTLLALTSGDFNKWTDEYNARLTAVGLNSEQAAKSGNRLATAFRGLEAEADVAGQALVNGPLGTALVKIIGFMDIITQRMALLFSNPSAALSNWMHPLQNLRDSVPISANTFTPAKAGTSWADTTAFFQRQGWSSAQAAGIAANIQRESGFDPTAKNPSSGAYGLIQWLGSRTSDFNTWAGKNNWPDLQHSGAQEQLAFIQYELDHKEKAAGDRLRATNDPSAAAEVFSTFDERPGANAAQTLNEARLRGDIAAKGGHTITTNITVNAPSGDAKSIASAITARQNDVYNNLVRNLGNRV